MAQIDWINGFERLWGVMCVNMFVGEGGVEGEGRGSATSLVTLDARWKEGLRLISIRWVILTICGARGDGL